MDPKTEARIRDRAYHLWMEAGGQHGRADDYWYQAEQEILSEQALADTIASAREEGPDRSVELLADTPDGATAGEAGVGHPQKPGEPLEKPGRGKAAAAKPAAPRPVAAKSAAATSSAPKSSAPKSSAPRSSAPRSSTSKPAAPKAPAAGKAPTAKGPKA